MPKVVVVGAGPGGLSAALLLQHLGHDVTVIEKDDRVGGRSKRLEIGPYRFSAGPSFLMYIEMLDLLFERVNLDWRADHDLVRLDPLYELVLPQLRWKPSGRPNQLKQQVHDLFNEGEAYERLMRKEAKAFAAVQSVMLKPFPSPLNFLNTRVLNFGRYVSLKKSVADKLKHHFKDPNLIHSMTFQAKYLGMSAQETPDFFTVLTYLEHQRGLYHSPGGIEGIVRYMAQQFKQRGGTLLLKQPVTQIQVREGVVQGVSSADKHYAADIVVANADFPHIVRDLLPNQSHKTYTPQRVDAMDYSVSAFMVYLGLDTVYKDVEHHTMIFSEDYDRYTQQLIDGVFPDDPTVYLYNPSKNDASYAPKGHSSYMLLAPVPNTTAPIDWEKEKDAFAQKILDRVQQKLHLKGFNTHIQVKQVLTPNDWKDGYRVHAGAVFSLKHQFHQMLHKRPHNAYNDVKNLYLVGGSTHPGSGLSTIVQSALIAADLIGAKHT